MVLHCHLLYSQKIQRNLLISSFYFRKLAFKHFFDYMDADQSGTLSMEEVMTAVHAFNMPVSTSLAKEIYDSVDLNKDGQIDLNEFLTFLASVKESY